MGKRRIFFTYGVIPALMVSNIVTTMPKMSDIPNFLNASQKIIDTLHSKNEVGNDEVSDNKIVERSKNIVSDNKSKVEIDNSNKKNDNFKVEKELLVNATAYSSLPEQTDDTPFITAMGSDVRDGIIAANFLPFKTKVRIPELYGDKVFVVEDRMNKRYNEANPPRIDLWMEDNNNAIKFGIKKINIEIISSL